MAKEGKNQENRLGSEIELLCEPDVSGMLTDLLYIPWTYCGSAKYFTCMILPPSYLLCLHQTWLCLTCTCCVSLVPAVCPLTPLSDLLCLKTLVA